MSKQTIPLGSEVRCVVSGVTGTATSMVERLNGNIQYGVQPKSENGASMPEAWEIDQQSLEVVGPGISDRVTEPVTTDIRIGQKVRDWVSGFEGVATSKHTYINGCVHFMVVPSMKSSKSLLNEVPTGSYLSVERLEAVEERKPLGGPGSPLSAAPEKPTGGPARRAARPA
jgi:hypothetical protein